MNPESTASELRKTGISVIGDLRWGTHFCCFYETKQDLLDTVVPYFKAGLENHEFCLWVVSPPLSVDEAKRALGQAVPDLDRHLAQGDLEILGHDEWYLRNGQHDPQTVLRAWHVKLNQALAAGYAGLRACGDGGWVHKDEWTVFHEYEKKLDALIADQCWIILCTYPLATSPGNQIFDVAHIHRMAVARRHGNWEIIETSELKQAKSEIKRLNAELEQKVEERTRELATTNEALRAEIAERKLAVDALKQAEERIRPIIDTIPAMAWSLRPDGVLDFVNQRWMDYTGLSFEEAIAEPTRTMHPEELPRVMEAWLAAMAAREPFEDEMRLRRADGEYRWFLVRTAPLLDEQGNIVKWYGTSTDIEDRRRAESTLRQREEDLRVLLENIPVAVYTCNQEGLIEYYNPKAVEMWGRAPIIRDTMQRYCGSFALYYTDGTPMPFEGNIMAQVIRTGIPQRNQEVVIERPDGTRVIALVNVAPLKNERGELIGAVNCVLDISGRKHAEDALRESEARTRLLIKSSNIGLWDWDLVTNDVFYSPEWKSQLGYAGDEVPGRYEEWESRLHPEDREPTLRAVQDFREGGREAYGIEFRLRHKDGSWRSILSRADLIRDAASQPVRMMGCHIDITERKEAERRIEHFADLFQTLSHHLLNIQEEERRHLARELHDEIGQTLTAAKLNLNIIASEVPPAVAGRLEVSIQILDRLLQQVRQLSLDLHPPMLDDLGLVPALRWLADQQAQRTGLRVTFTTNVEGLEMGPRLRTACFRLAQEAITNALRHAQAVTVSVELRAESDCVWLVVHDDGVGFDTAAMQQRAAGGASLGLLSMNERVALLGGELEVNSSPGRGTEIRAWFPLAPSGPAVTS